MILLGGIAMKNFKFVFTMLVIFTLLLTACSSKKADQEEQINNEKTEVMTEESDNSSIVEEINNKTDSITDEETDEKATNEVTTDNTEEIVDEDIATELGAIDITLMDRLLLESIKYKMPDSYMAVANESSMEGEVTNVTTYQKGFSIRTEIVEQDVTSILIYNADDGITYMYDLGETNGYAYEDDENDKLNRQEELDREGMSFLEILQTDMGDIEVKAEMDKFLGRKVVYIELTPSITDDSNEDESSGIWKMWIDAEYFVPLKYHMAFSDEWFFSSEVTEIKYNLELSNKLFEKPEGITFN